MDRRHRVMHRVASSDLGTRRGEHGQRDARRQSGCRLIARPSMVHQWHSGWRLFEIVLYISMTLELKPAPFRGLRPALGAGLGRTASARGDADLGRFRSDAAPRRPLPRARASPTRRARTFYSSECSRRFASRTTSRIRVEAVSSQRGRATRRSVDAELQGRRVDGRTRTAGDHGAHTDRSEPERPLRELARRF